MNSSTIDFSSISGVAVALIVMGVTIVLVFWYLQRRGIFAHSLVLELYELNQTVKQDSLSLLEQSWPILERAGFQKMMGRVVWYGESKYVSFGINSKKITKKLFLKNNKEYSIAIDEGYIKINLTLIAGQESKGENRLVTKTIYQTFLILLSSNTTNKNMQFVLSKERLESYQLFLSHDVKNLAQFITLLSEQAQLLQTDENKIMLVNRLQNLLPSLSDKAKKITQHMFLEKESFDDIEEIDILEAVQSYADQSELEIVLSSEEETIKLFISRSLLQQVLVELMDNFKSHSHKEGNSVLVFVLKQKNSAFLNFKFKKAGGESLSAERLFEPFWTTSKSGLGLGLFVIREVLKQINGKIEFSQNKDHIIFNMVLPSCSFPKNKAMKV